jgi:hypothetical protein
MAADHGDALAERTAVNALQAGPAGTGAAARTRGIARRSRARAGNPRPR